MVEKRRKNDAVAAAAAIENQRRIERRSNNVLGAEKRRKKRGGKRRESAVEAAVAAFRRPNNSKAATDAKRMTRTSVARHRWRRDRGVDRPTHRRRHLRRETSRASGWAERKERSACEDARDRPRLRRPPRQKRPPPTRFPGGDDSGRNERGRVARVSTASESDGYCFGFDVSVKRGRGCRCCYARSHRQGSCHHR